MSRSPQEEGSGPPSGFSVLGSLFFCVLTARIAVLSVLPFPTGISSLGMAVSAETPRFDSLFFFSPLSCRFAADTPSSGLTQSFSAFDDPVVSNPISLPAYRPSDPLAQGLLLPVFPRVNDLRGLHHELSRRSHFYSISWGLFSS